MEVMAGALVALGFFFCAIFFVWLALWFERHGL
jgi:hypothetical protein